MIMNTHELAQPGKVLHSIPTFQMIPDCDAVANIKFRAWLSEEKGLRLEVNLESLSDIVTRKGQMTTSSPSVIAYTAPHRGQHDSRSKGSTLIYKDSPEFVLFDWKKINEDSRSTFSLEVADRQKFLCLEMFDHSALKTHKYFRGAVYLPLAELGEDAGVTLTLPLKKLPALGREISHCFDS